MSENLFVHDSALGRRSSRNRRIHLFSAIVPVALLIALFTSLYISESLRRRLKHSILNELIDIDPIPPETKADAIYVLGGTPRSLGYKFAVAGRLYRDDISRKIMILSREGKTAYSRKLGRNLTNNEWALLNLNRLGIQTEHIEPVHVEKGFFGTLSEAKAVSDIIEERNYQRLVLISSPEHTRRVKQTFKNLINDDSVTIYVLASQARVPFRELLIEFAKLKVYQYFLS